MNAITRTDFTFEGQRGKYTGKVRDVYDIDDRYLVMVVTDRISAFDVVLPEGIPYKGQVLNQIAHPCQTPPALCSHLPPLCQTCLLYTSPSPSRSRW